MTKRDVYWAIIVVVLVGVLFSLQRCNSSQAKIIALQNQVLNDSLVITTNKLNQQTATIGLIQTDFATFKKVTFAKEDSIGRALKKLVTRRTISATVATTEVNVRIDDKTDEVTFKDDTCNPTYTFSDTTQYRHTNIIASRDSFHIRQRIFERLEFTQEFSKWNLFKKQRATTSFKNYNPEVEIVGLRTYTTECDCKKKVWIGFIGGNVTGFVTGVGVGYLTGKLK